MIAVLIPQDDDEEVMVVNLSSVRYGLADLQRLVGGYVESVPWHDRRDDVSVFINEEGKFDVACRPNGRATALLRPVLLVHDTIMGNAVVTGVDVGTGDTIDCPPEVVAQLVPA